MGAPIFVGSGFVAKYPKGGGNFWVPLQYVLGLRDAGIDAYWLEVLPGTGAEACDRRRAARFLARAARFGLAGRAIVFYLPDGRDGDRRELLGAEGAASAEIAARMRDGVLLNLANSLPRQCRSGFARTVLYDIDPGMFQLWSTQWAMGVGEHDLYFTIGRRIGDPDCRVPTLGVAWHKVWPAVHLAAWPQQRAPGQRYTTITQWWNGDQGYDLIDGELYEHNKRTSFLEFADMPRRSGLELELAANITPGEAADRALIAASGWRLVEPHRVAGTPGHYRRYVQASRGEFSCAKPSVIKAAPGWISDRTICYLASGRPCIVQAAGAERCLPPSLGLQFFASKDEAVAALRAVERDYQTACREARRLAEEFFATAVVIREVLRILGEPPGRPARVLSDARLGRRSRGRQSRASAARPIATT